MKFCKLFFVYLLISSSYLMPQTLHLFILADDTDETTAVSSIKNMMNIEQSFSYLASLSNLPIHITKCTVSQNTLSRSKVIRSIRKSAIADDDIVVLYYSGHGCREQGESTILPAGAFFNERRHTQNSPNFFIVEFSEITRRLLSKKAALYIILLDCCNVLIPKNIPITDDAIIQFDIKNFQNLIIPEKIKKLFQNQYGFIVSSGTSPKEHGWAHSMPISRLKNQTDMNFIPTTATLGGVFTKSFLNNLFQELQTETPTWSTILKNTTHASTEETKKQRYPEKKNAFSLPHNFQTPQYRVFTHTKRYSRSIYKKYFFKTCAYKLRTAKSLNPFLLDPLSKTCSNLIKDNQ